MNIAKCLYIFQTIDMIILVQQKAGVIVIIDIIVATQEPKKSKHYIENRISGTAISRGTM